MWGKLTTVYWLVAALGLGSAAAQAAPSPSMPAPVKAVSEAGVSGLPVLMQLAQNDITISPETAAGGAPLVGGTLLPVPGMPGPAGSARIALLLPLQSSSLGHAAAAVRNGFMAAYEKDRSLGISVSVEDSGEATADILRAYTGAAFGHDIVVGPLSRSGTAAIAEQAQIQRPTLALTQTEANVRVPANMLMMGLSVEQEARQVAAWTQAEHPGSQPLVVATGTAWQRRAAAAFVDEWERLGNVSEQLELRFSDGFLDANMLASLQERLQSRPPAFIFAALSAAQARQLRIASDRGVPLYGTSQLNPVALPDWSVATPVPEMNGVRLVDLPWQLQADHPAVMSYPRPAAIPGQARNADLERLYALGIDAYRVAREIAAQRQQFSIDGVTGKLKIDLQSPNSFQRTEAPAVYDNGVVVPLLTRP